jgi:hypothetical protein
MKFGFRGAATGIARRVARGKGFVGCAMAGVSERPRVGPDLGAISGQDAEASSMSGLIFLLEVFEDVAQAAQWYDKEGGPDLGHGFVACFYAYLPHNVSQGQVHRKVYQDFRTVLLKPFGC